MLPDSDVIDTHGRNQKQYQNNSSQCASMKLVPVADTKTSLSSVYFDVGRLEEQGYTLVEGGDLWVHKYYFHHSMNTFVDVISIIIGCFKSMGESFRTFKKH